MADNNIPIKVELDLKNLEKSMATTKNLVKKILSTITKDGKVSKEQIKELGDVIGDNLTDAFAAASEESEKFLEKTAKGIEKVGGMLENAKGLLNGWGTAFAKISVLKEAASGVTSFVGGMLQDSMKLETAMNKLAFVSKDVKQNFDGFQDSFRSIGRSVPIKETGDLAEALKGLVANGFDAHKSLKLVELGAKGAVAGSISVTQSVGALNNILSSYKLELSEATKIQDLLFK